MNIKSLLLGSAAALVAVSGARAADVIVPVAPEPVEYVKVCDVYGTGFYYIPGTETCLKIGGYVRYQINATGDIDDGFGNHYNVNDEDDTYRVGSQVRVRLDFDAREETELGTLRAFARVQATNSFGYDSNDQVYSMDQGYLQLGGLTMGYTDSMWKEGSGLLTDSDSIVGDIQTNRISYTYASDGFTVGASIEDDSSGDWVPDVVGRIGYSGGWGSVFIAGVYDERQIGGRLNPIDDFIFLGDQITIDGLNTGDDDGAFALKAGLSLKDLIATDSELKIEGTYAFDPTDYSTLQMFDTTGRQLVSGFPPFAGYNTFVNSTLDNIPSKWQIGAAYAQSFGKLGVAVSGLYGETFDFDYIDPAGNTFEVGDANYWRVVGNVGYEITKNFSTLAEVRYQKLNFDVAGGNGDVDVDQTSGFLRFVRSF
jgi:hypothetical protein